MYSQEDVEAPPESCPAHPTKVLMFHCGTCKCDVCEDCWANTHDGHVVNLLSKKVNDAKTSLQQQMETSIQQIATQVIFLCQTDKPADLKHIEEPIVANCIKFTTQLNFDTFGLEAFS